MPDSCLEPGRNTITMFSSRNYQILKILNDLNLKLLFFLTTNFFQLKVLMYVVSVQELVKTYLPFP